MYDFLSRTGALESRAQPYAEVPGELFVEKRCCTIEHTDPNPVVNGMAAPKRLEKAQHGHPRLGVASTQAIEHWLQVVCSACLRDHYGWWHDTCNQSNPRVRCFLKLPEDFPEPDSIVIPQSRKKVVEARPEK